MPVLAAAMLTVSACSAAVSSTNPAASASAACASAGAQVAAYVKAGQADAAPRPNPAYGQTQPSGEDLLTASDGSVITLPPELDPGYAPTITGDPVAAAQQYLLASYVVVQHPTCFTDAELAAAQERIDQSK